MMKRASLAVLCLLFFSLTAFAQGASTYHVFPHLVDGSFADGTFYRSAIYAVNTTTLNAICTLRFFGLCIDRLQAPNEFTLVAGGGVLRAITRGTGAFGRGYGTLSCSEPVQAFLQYEYVSPSQSVLGTAAVFPAIPSLAAEFLFPPVPGYRLGVAVANDTDGEGVYSIRVAAAGPSEVRTTVTIPARSSIAQFVDELVSMPPGFNPVAILIETVGANQNPVRTIGLVFSGGTFSTVPAMIFAQ